MIRGGYIAPKPLFDLALDHVCEDIDQFVWDTGCDSTLGTCKPAEPRTRCTGRRMAARPAPAGLDLIHLRDGIPYRTRQRLTSRRPCVPDGNRAFGDFADIGTGNARCHERPANLRGIAGWSGIVH